MNLSKVVGSYVEEQKTINAQINQRIKNVESSMDKKIDGIHKSLNQKIYTMQSSISSLKISHRYWRKGGSPLRHCPILGECMNLAIPASLLKEWMNSRPLSL